MLIARLCYASSNTARRRGCRLSDPGWLTKGERLRCWRPEVLGMNRKNQDRGALIDRMPEARSEQEVEAAEKGAEGWFKENPDDVRVVAASERPPKTGARARGPEGGGGRRRAAVC